MNLLPAVKRYVLYTVIAVLFWLILSFHSLLVFVPHLFQITGFPFGGKTYLILMQNEAELRPGGGFIAAYGELTFHYGVFPSFFIKDVFSLKGYKDDTIVEPPYPMGELLKNRYYKGFSFHDSNWIPDLPTSAKTTLEFYKTEAPDKHIDGVFVVNYSFVEHLLGLFKEITIDGKNLTAENLFHTIEYEQNNIDLHNIDALAGRKSILSTLGNALIKKVITSPEKYLEISNAIRHELDSKNITLYFTDTNLTTALQSTPWMGKFPSPTEHKDIFAVVEANLGMKSDRYISRNYAYRVQVERNSENPESLDAIGKVALTFTHHGDYNAPLSHVYKGYIRIYAPAGSTLLPGFSSDIEPYKELGYTVFGKKIEINPKESIQINLAYTLPKTIVTDDTYALSIFKQSGLENTTYQAAIETPIDFLIASKDFSVHENVATFSKSIEKDTSLTLKFSRDSTPPRVTNQEFIDVNKIIIQFNEPIQKSDCENIENYSIVDTDKKAPDVPSKPRIRFIKCDARQATIYTQNIRKQEGEFFTATLKNIRDLSNNVMLPNPMNITLVQRLDPIEEKK